MKEKVVSILEIPINTEIDYSLPILMNSNDIVVEHSIPSFVEFTFPNYKFRPKMREELGKYKIKGKLTNSYGSSYFSFFV
jgi:hypothetical protein